MCLVGVRYCNLIVEQDTPNGQILYFGFFEPVWQLRDFQGIKSPNKRMIIILSRKEKQPTPASPS
ncbi:MAG: hypothetical protein V7K20_00625, partial [Nostoc sp.]